jgi:tetratricopeptide (TPR) repeat protein
MLVTDLAQTPGLDVVSSQRIHQILTEIGQEDLDSINKSLVPEIAERAGAGAVVLGSIFKSGSEIRLDVQVQDVSSGRVLSAESVRGDDVFPLVDELTDRIRASLDLGDRPAGRPVAEVTTASLEAFQLYSEGLEARRNFRIAEGRKLFERAVELDPSFAMAYHELWRGAQRLGEMSLADQYREKTLEHLDQLPERQKLRIQAADLVQIQGKTDEAIEILETLIARYPDEEDAYEDLWVIYAWRGELEKRVALLQRGVEANPRSGPLHNSYGYALLHSARYAEGIREFETYAELSPNEPNPYDSLGEAYLLTGQPEKALGNYARALEVDPSFGIAHNGRAWAFGILGRYDEALEEFTKARDARTGWFSPASLAFFEAFTLSRVGRYREAEAKISQGVDQASSQNDAVGQLDLECLSAQIAIERADYAAATNGLRRVAEKVSQITQASQRDQMAFLVELLTGAAEARRQNLEAARAHLETQREMHGREATRAQSYLPILQGEIALAAGDLTAAESAFLDAEPESKMMFNLGAGTQNIFFNNNPFVDGPARVKRARGDLAGAIKIYRKLTTPDISSKYTSMLEPRFVLELARLLDETGDREGARAEYQRFLELWKDADAGLPELKEARAYVAK